MSGVTAISQAQGLIVAGVGVALLAFAGGLLYLRTRRKEAGPDIPSVMRPGPSDPDLETPLLVKLQGWGLLLFVFLGVWFPLVWLIEPGRNLKQEEAIKTDAIARGALAVMPFSEFNQGGQSCVRCHGPELRGQIIPVAGATYPSANLTTVCSRLTIADITSTIEQGRQRTVNGTTLLVMPSWSIKYAGALDDQQISDLVQYLVYINRDTVPFKDNKCLNPQAGKSPSASPSASASGSAAPSASPTKSP